MFCKEVKKIWLKYVYYLTEMKSREERHQMCRCWRQNWEVCVLSSARKQGQGIPLLTVPSFPNHKHFLDPLLSVCGSFFSFPNSQPPFKLKVSPTPVCLVPGTQNLTQSSLSFPPPHIKLSLSSGHLCGIGRQAKLPLAARRIREVIQVIIFLICFFTQKLPLWRKRGCFIREEGV